MNPVKRMRIIAVTLTLAMLMAIVPVTSLASQPTLIPSIKIHVSGFITVTLTNVYEFYHPFGLRMGLYMAPNGTITLNDTDGPYYPGIGVLTAGTPFSFADLTFDGSAVSFYLAYDAATDSYKWLDDYMHWVGQRYENRASIMINQFFTFEDFAANLEEARRSLRDREWQEFVPSPDNAPIIPSITIRPPEIFEDDDLNITFTNVRDIIGRADITLQSQIWFYMEPNGTISFNRDMRLTTETGEVISLSAGEVLNVYEHASQRNFYGELMLHFHYGDFPVPPEYTPDGTEGLYRQHAIVFKVAHYPESVPIMHEWMQRVSNYTVQNAATTTAATAARTLRFAIGSTTFADNGVNQTIEAAPFIANDRTMVPLRVIVEALGATNLTFAGGVISFVLNGETITMTVGQPLPNNMGTPVIVAERTFVPLAYVMDEIGAQARWDGNARAAYVYID